jgi:hypothetical protein
MPSQPTDRPPISIIGHTIGTSRTRRGAHLLIIELHTDIGDLGAGWTADIKLHHPETPQPLTP